MHTLERFGVQKIEAVGQPFDPNLHEAVMEVDEPENLPNTVVRVVEDGYTIHDRLLRPARVVVAKRDRTDGPQSVAEAPSGTSRSRSPERLP